MFCFFVLCVHLHATIQNLSGSGGAPSTDPVCAQKITQLLSSAAALLLLLLLLCASAAAGRSSHRCSVPPAGPVSLLLAHWQLLRGAACCSPLDAALLAAARAINAA
jgi:hypothetical protein